MIYISHRGNIDHVDKTQENKKYYIQEAIDLGYDVEIDVRKKRNGSLWLGHDECENPVELEWLLERKDNLWIHAKNYRALSGLIDEGLRVFYHLAEAHTVIGNTKIIWSHNLVEADKKSIIPLIDEELLNFYDGTKEYYGICSDFVRQAKEKLN